MASGENGEPAGHLLSRRRLLIAGVGALAAGGTAYGLVEWTGQGSTRPVRFRTLPGLRPPSVTTTVPAESTGPGLIFIGPGGTAYQHGPMIVDDQGELVWFRPLPTGMALNVQVQQYGGRPVLAWWEGKVVVPGGYGLGEYVLVDHSYREVARIRAANGLMGDLHDLVLTPEGTALFTVYRKVPADLSPVGGPRRGTLLDSLVQEVDIASGRLLMEWSARQHVALKETYLTAAQAESRGFFDFFHINSIDIDSDGDLLISGRHTWAVYKVARKSGQVIWRLNGKKSDFTMGARAQFAFQHHARHHPGGVLTLFDDGGGTPDVELRSRGLMLALDTTAMMATAVHEYLPDPTFLSTSQGSVQVLPDGHVFVGWGAQPYWSEYSVDGRLLYDARLPAGEGSYRAFRFPWTGRPADRPAVATSQRDDGSITAYASWNGATEVTHWQVLAGGRAHDLEPVAITPKRGFETSVTIPGGRRYVGVVARDGTGHALGASQVVSV